MLRPSSLRPRSPSRQRSACLCLALLVSASVVSLGVSTGAGAETYQLPLFVSETDDGQVGVLRLNNDSVVSGTVSIRAIDDAGTRSAAATLTLAGNTSVEFEAADLATGNTSKGLAGSIGAIGGHVRLEIETELAIDVLSYLRANGILSVLHDEIRPESGSGGSYQYVVPVFHATGHQSQAASSLRLVNPGSQAASVTIRDRASTANTNTVSLMLPEGWARVLTAAELEGGGSGLTGQLGTGTSGWRLTVSADAPIHVVNLVTSSAGRLDNLSSSGRQGLAPVSHELFNERFVGQTVSTLRGSTSTEIRLLEDDAFEDSHSMNGDLENADAAMRAGSYTYRRTSEDAGQLALSYDDGAACAMNLHFTSRGDGWYATRCETSEMDDQPSDGEPDSVWHGGSWSASDTDMPTGAGNLRFITGGLSQDYSYTLGAEIAALRLPTATGATGALVYGLTPGVPGLIFDAATRELTGAPTTSGVYDMTYSAADAASGSRLTWSFRITVTGGQAGTCSLGLVLRAGSSCVYPGSSEAVSISADGSMVSFLVFRSARGINLENRRSRGTVYDLEVTPDSAGVWRIVRIMGEAEPDTAPEFQAGQVDDQTFTLGEAISALTLPAAMKGNGSLSYSLAPSVPGLAFDPVSRSLTGTPTRAGTLAMTYSVSDEDNDTASLSFAITVRDPNAAAPDLVAGTATADDTSVTVAQSFRVSVRVRNQGEAGAAATSVTFYRSSDMNLSNVDDTRIGTANLGALGVGANQQVSVTETAPSTPGQYYYFACANSPEGENAADNNCSAGVRVRVNEAARVPDLRVTSLRTSATSASISQSVRLTATVRNQGAAPSPERTRVRYVLSSDSTITTSDRQIDTDTVAVLAPSGEAVESETVSLPATSGIYYLGACVEPVVGEENTANNCSRGVRINVTSGGGGVTPSTPRPDPVPTQGPDLTLDNPRVSNSRPDAGTVFNLSVRVRNRGNQPAQATTVSFYRSTDSRIDATDTFIARLDQDGLPTSDSNTLTAKDVQAPLVPGTYYYGACAAPVVNELNVTNNCSSAASIRVQVDGPNLAVDVSANTAQPSAGRNFVLRATVRNVGNQQADATRLTFYRSDDAVITLEDDSIPPITQQQNPQGLATLGASGSRSFSLTVTASEVVGTAYYGACVVSVSDDRDVSNDCSSAVKVTVPGADLVIESVKVDDATPEPGDRIELNVIIRNRGTEDAEATTLTYYRSTDATITTNDQPEGTDDVKSLDRRESGEESLRFAAQTTAGVSYYGACIETVPSEGDATNNCSDAVLVKVGAPDLVLQSPRLDDRTPEAGERFRLTVRVRNIGHAEAPATTLQFYRSADDQIPEDDEQLTETASVGSLSINEYADESGRLTAPDQPGDYFVYACVPNDITAESNTMNNCSTPLKITVPAPDLTVDRPSADDSTPEAGDRFSLTARIRNRGAGTAGDSTLTYYRSDDETIDTSDDEVGTDSVSDIPPSSSETETISLTAPAPGVYYYRACVEILDTESNQENNCSSALRVTVPAPDLYVVSPGVDDSTLETGDDFEFRATVRNRGAGTAPATTLHYYQAQRTDFSDQTKVGTADSVKSLDPRESSPEDVDLIAPETAGTYYYRACVEVEERVGESDTDNNCSSRVAVLVREPRN